MIRQRFKSLSFVLLLVLMTTLSGCGTSGQTGGTEQEHRLVVDLANEPATLDPGLQYNTDSYTVYRNIFDNLLRRDSKTLEIQPWVAESWKQENENTWTFAIRSDIKFQNGAPLTAQDVAFSIRRILDKDFKSPQYANYSQITEVNASGNVVTITTDGPSPSLLAQLVNLSIVPEKYVKESGNENFNLHPIGSGAYKFSDWQKGVEINLETNPDYWQGKPSISGVRFRFVSNPASRIADLQSGQADIALALNADDIEVLKSNNDLQTLSVATERVAYLALNCLGDSPTKSVNVRQAIAYGINYESIISSLLKGYGKPVKEVLTPLSFGYDDTVEGYTYNPEKAKQLLKDAGLEKITIEFPTSPAYDQRIIQAIQGDLSKVGIDVKIVNSDQATYLKKYRILHITGEESASASGRAEPWTPMERYSRFSERERSGAVIPIRNLTLLSLPQVKQPIPQSAWKTIKKLSRSCRRKFRASVSGRPTISAPLRSIFNGSPTPRRISLSGI